MDGYVEDVKPVQRRAMGTGNVTIEIIVAHISGGLRARWLGIA